jgi:protein O-mannosyl-transferase
MLTRGSQDHGGLSPLPIALGLALLTLLTYLPVLDHGFVAYDDDLYVTANPRVQAGVTAEGLRWAATAVVAANWHPLTLVSHMLDCELYGLNPRGHYLTSLLLHVGNVLLLFAFLRRTSGATGRSAAVAALFAVHPTHVESVAWIAERKDVLSGCFFLLALAAYAGYARRPGLGRYLLVALLFALGLLAKPMLVTLPCVLLLLDVWPLGRFRRAASARERAKLVLEKLPLFALSALASVATLAAQQRALASAEILPLDLRIANALVSYMVYLGKTFLPRHLAVFYPMPLAIPPWKVAAAGLLLAGLTAASLRLAHRAPYLAVGWLWFLGMLAPVSGLVQVGSQAMADRYTYLPSIGLLVAVVWGAADLMAALRTRRAEPPPRSLAPARDDKAGVSQDRGVPGRTAWGGTPASTRAGAARPILATVAFAARPILATAACAAVLALAVAARAQTSHWRDSVSLFRHAAAVTEGNYVAHLNLAEALRQQGRPAEALPHYRAAVAARPGLASPRLALGSALRAWGRPAEALPWLRSALALDSSDPRAHATLAMALDDLGREDEAIEELRRALELDPGLANARAGLDLLLARKRAGRPPPAGMPQPPPVFE